MRGRAVIRTPSRYRLALVRTRSNDCQVLDPHLPPPHLRTEIEIEIGDMIDTRTITILTTVPPTPWAQNVIEAASALPILLPPTTDGQDHDRALHSFLHARVVEAEMWVGVVAEGVQVRVVAEVARGLRSGHREVDDPLWAGEAETAQEGIEDSSKGWVCNPLPGILVG